MPGQYIKKHIRSYFHILYNSSVILPLVRKTDSIDHRIQIYWLCLEKWYNQTGSERVHTVISQSNTHVPFQFFIHSEHRSSSSSMENISPCQQGTGLDLFGQVSSQSYNLERFCYCKSGQCHYKEVLLLSTLPALFIAPKLVLVNCINVHCNEF
jgi:hypothetical protein